MDSAQALRVLRLQHGATQVQIRAAYKKLSRQYHPDKNIGRETTAVFQSVNEAYHVLVSETVPDPDATESEEESSVGGDESPDASEGDESPEATEDDESPAATGGDESPAAAGNEEESAEATKGAEQSDEPPAAAPFKNVFGDKSACKTLLGKIPNYLVICGSELYVYVEATGLFSNNPAHIIRVIQDNLDGVYGENYAAAKRLLHLLPSYVKESPHFFNSDDTKGFVHCENGVLDLHTHLIEAHSPFRPSRVGLGYVVGMAPMIDYCAYFEQKFFYGPLGQTKAAWLLERLADSLSGVCHKQGGCISLVGKHNTGKSSIMKLVELVFGGYAMNFDAQNMNVNGSSDAAAQNAIFARNKDARVIYASELNGAMDGNKMKRGISGNLDAIQSRVPYGHAEAIVPNFLMLTASNESPRLINVDEAVVERMAVVRMTIQHVKSDDTAAEIKSPRARAAMLSSLLGAKARKERDGPLDIPQDILADTHAAYPIAEFIPSGPSTLEQAFLRDHTITGDKADFITSIDVRDWIAKNAPESNETRLAKIVRSYFSLHGMGDFKTIKARTRNVNAHQNFTKWPGIKRNDDSAGEGADMDAEA